MMEIKRKFYGAQYQFVTADERFLLLHGGVGSGKSQAGAGRALLAALGRLGSQDILAPNVGVITAPTYNMLRDATLRTFLEVAGELVERVSKSPPINIVLKNGSEILLRSADQPDNLRGPSISWWWGDEASYCAHDTWRVMIGRLRQYGRAGSAWITTTPKGKNWLWQIFVRDHAQHADYRSFRLATLENPFIEMEFYHSLANAYVSDFARQELEGEFVSFEGLIYPEFDRHKHLAHVAPFTPTYTVAGVDWGFANPGCIVVVEVGGGDMPAHVAHEEHTRRRLIEDWVRVAVQLRDAYKIHTFFCDPSEPDYIRLFQAAGLKAQPANHTVNTGIQLVRARLVRRVGSNPALTFNPNCVHILSEFEQYCWMDNSTGLKEQPIKANDHGLDALRYAVIGIDHQDTHLEISRENPFYN
jgi:phage terminase large subunit